MSTNEPEKPSVINTLAGPLFSPRQARLEGPPRGKRPELAGSSNLTVNSAVDCFEDRDTVHACPGPGQPAPQAGGARQHCHVRSVGQGGQAKAIKGPFSREFKPNRGLSSARGAGGGTPAAHVASAFDCQGRNPLDRPNPDFPKPKNPDSVLLYGTAEGRERAKRVLEAQRGWPLVWRWAVRLPERKGQRCRILRRWPKKNSVLVEFQDGYRVVTSGWAVRKGPAEEG